MQRIDNDGLRQEIETFNQNKMIDWLNRENTSSVEVFKGTKQNIEYRKKEIGKPFKHKSYTKSKKYKKVCSIKKTKQ